MEKEDKKKWFEVSLITKLYEINILISDVKQP